ncbi:MAG: 30S ribosomal protein S8 [Calditrichaeota bacterium]|nr:MAG: 30S ribosomal protein S8 [Calditrichota bacterium]
MAVTDPISDYLTRIRNAQKARHTKVDIPASKMKRAITKILKKQGYIRSYVNIDDGLQGVLRVYLKYNEDKKPVIDGLKRVSRPGLRRYAKATEMPRVRNNFGIAIVTTPQGLMTNIECRQRNVGGEILCYIW